MRNTTHSKTTKKRKWHNAQTMKNKNSTKLRNRDIKISGWTFHVLGRRSSKKHCSHLRFSPCRAKRAEKSKTCTWRQKWPENDLLRHSHLECNLLPEPSKTKKSNLLPEPQNPPQLDSCRFREEANGFELQKSKKNNLLPEPCNMKVQGGGCIPCWNPAALSASGYSRSRDL